MNVVDSSGWLEYYTGGPNAAFFRPVIESDENVIVPTVSIYEVFRHVLRNVGEEDALVAVGAMQERNVVALLR